MIHTSKLTPLISIGATGQAIVLSEFIEDIGYSFVAFYDRNVDILSPIKHTPIFHGLDLLFDWVNLHHTEKCHGVVAIGGHRGQDRKTIGDLLLSKGIRLTTLIHPHAYVAKNATIGIGTQIMAGSIISSKCIIGDQCILNTRSSVDHESKIGCGVHIGPGATLAGSTTIQKFSFIGAGATILPRISIGQNTIVGAGSVVTKNLPNGVIACGNPAKVIGSSSKILYSG